MQSRARPIDIMVRDAVEKSTARLENQKQELADQFFSCFHWQKHTAKGKIASPQAPPELPPLHVRTLRNLVADANFGKTLKTSKHSWLKSRKENKQRHSELELRDLYIYTRRDNQARTATAQELSTRFFSGWRKCYGYNFHGFCVFLGAAFEAQNAEDSSISTQIMPTNSDTFCTSLTNTAAHCSSSVTHAHTKQSGLDASSATDPSTKT